MPIPKVSKKDILKALAEFDSELRESNEWAGWEDSLAQRHALLHEGRRYPPKKIVSMATQMPVSTFSGGPMTNGYLEARGFEVASLRRRVLADTLEQILAGYPDARTQQTFSAEAPMRKLLRQAGDLVGSEDVLGGSTTLKVVASAGQGNWARVPWISFLDSRETDSTQKGVYVVILFRQDGSGLYLTFNQGVTEPMRRLGNADGITAIKSRAEELRDEPWCQSLRNAGFLLDSSIDLRAEGGLGKGYEASAIAHKFYAKGGIPDDDQLFNDLRLLLEAYKSYLAGTGEKMPIIHLLIKWTIGREPRTVEIHKEIADREGSVWWGKFGDTGISQARLGQLQAQLDAGQTTYAFLSGAGTLFRATLSQVTQDATQVDARRLPDYYRREECALFYRLSNLETVERDWLIANFVMDSNPAPGSAEIALSSQANPAYLRHRGGSWVFQGNPEYFDSRAAIRQLQEIRWLANQYATEIQKGDRVYLWESGANAGVIGIAEVTETVQTVEDDEASAPFQRAPERFVGLRPRVRLKIIQVCDPYLPRDVIRDDPRLSNLAILRMANGTNFRVTDAEREALDELVRSPSSAEDPMEALLAHTLLDAATLTEIVTTIREGSPQIVLAGPPGTSKTWIAEAIARFVSGIGSRVRLVQFHPNYSYEAFVEGLRPVAKSGGISFEQQRGALLDLVEDMKSANQLGSNADLYVMVIDEMNRGNLPRVFGELMYLFEYRDRTIRLQYSDGFALPSNLRFIGTMNTADRSIRSIDIALRRRFDVFELRPDAEMLKRFFKLHPMNVPNLISGFEKLNQELETMLDRHHTIGHAFFMKAGINQEMLRAIWRRKIYPLIEEYFFDQPDIARGFTFEKFWG